jgi:hypothetical protein
MMKFDSNCFKKFLVPMTQANPQLTSILERPTIVCLCGATRFYDVLSKLNLEETLAGKIVLSIASDRQTEQSIFEALNESELERVKEKLGLLHFQKIDLADEILVVNVGGYVGESTTREILYARESKKNVRWLEPENISARLSDGTIPMPQPHRDTP